jgi:hypothetical protein
MSHLNRDVTAIRNLLDYSHGRLFSQKPDIAYKTGNYSPSTLKSNSSDISWKE